MSENPLSFSSHDTEPRSRSRMCFELMDWAAYRELDEAETREKRWLIYRETMAGLRPCPLFDSCPRAQKAKEAGKQFLWEKQTEAEGLATNQLSLF